MEARKFILEKFQDHLRSGYEAYCERHGLEKTEDRFLTFIIDQQLIPYHQLNRYTLIREYETLCDQENCPKTKAVDTLANKFRLSERTIWNILRHARPSKR